MLKKSNQSGQGLLELLIVMPFFAFLFMLMYRGFTTTNASSVSQMWVREKLFSLLENQAYYPGHTRIRGLRSRMNGNYFYVGLNREPLSDAAFQAKPLLKAGIPGAPGKVEQMEVATTVGICTHDVVGLERPTQQPGPITDESMKQTRFCFDLLGR